MNKCATLVVFFLIASHSAAFAQSTCPPEKLAAAIDTYADQPFGARAWRMLNSLGDPGIEPENISYVDYQANEEWTKLVTEISPAKEEPQEIGYDCRMSYPLTVLKERVSRFGAKSAHVKQWLLAQQSVIEACSDPTTTNVMLPPPLEATGEEQKLQADDRAYQQASLAFYNNKPMAAELFKAIGASNSVHKGAARYNLANLLANGKDIAAAKAEAAAILSDPSIKSVHKITEDLLGYIANIEDTPDGWNKVISRALRDATQPLATIKNETEARKAYAAALYDLNYAGIASKIDDWWIIGRLPPNPTLSKAIYDQSRAEPMALWMMTGQSIQSNYNSLPWNYSTPKWNSYTRSYVERAMAIQPSGVGITGLAKESIEVLKATTDDASRTAWWTKAKAAMSVASKSCGEAPETVVAGHLLQHAVRLSALAGKFDEVYGGLSDVPFKSASAYHTRVVFTLGQYLLATGNLEEGRRYRDRLLTPDFFAGLPQEKREGVQQSFSTLTGWLAEDEIHWRQALALSQSKLANPLINLLPAGKLRDLADDPVFNAAEKALLLRSAWTRNYARGISQKPERLKTLFAANPELKEAYDKVASDYPAIKTKDRLLLTILRNPRFGILVSSPDASYYVDPIEAKRESFAELDQWDPNDKNWWCPLQPDRHLISLHSNLDNLVGGQSPGTGEYIDHTVPVQMAAARAAMLKLHPMVRMIDWQEVDNLADAQSAPKLLATQALAWAKTSEGLDGAPEALALAVRATRYGCRWFGGHKAYSKPAQELLKSKFASTTWTTNTPYWFDCVDQQWDANYNKVATCKPKTWPKQSRPQ